MTPLLWFCQFTEKLTKWAIVSTLMIIPIVAAIRSNDLRYLWTEIGMALAACVIGVEKKQ